MKSQHVKQYLRVFVSCLGEKSAFDSQAKETLTGKRDIFGSVCQLPEEMKQTDEGPMVCGV